MQLIFITKVIFGIYQKLKQSFEIISFGKQQKNEQVT